MDEMAQKAYDAMPNDVAIFRISLAAKIAGVSTGTIRTWEARGLLSPKSGDGKNHRFYSKDDIEYIKSLKQLLWAAV